MTTTSAAPATSAEGTSASPTVTRAWATEIILALTALTFVAHAVRLLQRHTFWYDEAMLLVNITEAGWRDLAGPLPFYDQAAPQLYLVLLKLLHSVFGLSEVWLRLPSLLAAAAAVWIVARRMPGLTAIERACAAAFLAGGITFAYLTTETKQYTFEVLCSALLMTVFARRHTTGADDARAATANTNASTSLTHLGVLIALMLSASTFPLAAFAVGAVAILAGVRRTADLNRLIVPRLLSGGWVFAVAGMLYVIYYARHIRPAYEALLLNFGYTYQGFGFAREASYPLWLAEKAWSIPESHYGVLALPLIAVGCLGVLTMRRRGLPYHSQFGLLIALVIVLNLGGIYPLLPARFSVFILPWIAVLAGVGIARLLHSIDDDNLQSIAAGGVALVVLFPAITYILDPTTHQARASIDALRANPTGPIMVTVSGQPVYDLYVKAPTVPGADRCLAPGVLGYTNRCRALKAPGDGVMQGAATKWYLLNYAAIIGRGVPPVGFPGGYPGAAPQTFADNYLDWLVYQIPAGTPVRLFSAPHTERDTDGDPLQARLKRMATVQRLVDERTPASAVRAGQVDRVTRGR